MENPYENKIMPLTSITAGLGMEAMPDLYVYPIQIVNVCMIGSPEQSDGWVLLDAGMPRSAEALIREAEKRFARSPQAIVLTHGHFDHVGAVVELVREWKVPVYAHEYELPYLTGKANYPQGDPTVDGGFVSELSPLFPNAGIDLGEQVRALPGDGSVPGLPEWRWIPTPGHTPGHVSLFRERDRVLLAGDAFVTVHQESLYKVITQKLEISGPPKYFTTDWTAAKASVRLLAQLSPQLAVTGHGLPMSGERLRQDLAWLAEQFDEAAVPEDGRFVPG